MAAGPDALKEIPRICGIATSGKPAGVGSRPPSLPLPDSDPSALRRLAGHQRSYRLLVFGRRVD